MNTDSVPSTISLDMVRLPPRQSTSASAVQPEKEIMEPNIAR